MRFHEDLVNIIQVLDRQIAESKILASVDVDFEHNVFVCKVFLFYYVLQRPVLQIFLLSNLSYTDVFVFVVIVVSVANGVMLVCAIELVVRHYMCRSYVATEVIESVNTQIDHSLRAVNKIIAYDIATVSFVSISFKYTVSVLYLIRFTL